MRTFLIILFTFLLPLSYSLAEKARPNIIYIMTDDQRWDTFGCYGRPEFQTTHIDKLAKEGVIFDNVYFAVSICAPSRATVMTGRYFASHQSGFSYPFNRRLTKEDFDNTYPAIFKNAGYRTGFIGKFGMFTERGGVKSENYFDYYAVRGRFIPKDDKELAHIYRKERDPKERTLKKGDAMIHFLDSQPKDKPFCLSVSFDAVKNNRDEDMYGPHTAIFENKTMSVPQNWVEGMNKKMPEVVQKYARGYRLHKTETSTPALYQKVARRFATQGYTVDQQVARLMKKLKEMNVLDNTIIIYTSDNGRFHGSHGLFSKALLYDDVMKAPFIVYDGRVAKRKRGYRESALVSFVDIAPTIIAMAGLEIPESMQGRDFSNILNKTQDRNTWRDYVFMENLFIEEIFKARIKGVEDLDEVNTQIIEGNRSYRSRGVRNTKYKYFVYYEQHPAIEELYDLSKDPQEMNNVAHDPSYKKVLVQLREKTEDLYQKHKQE